MEFKLDTLKLKIQLSSLVFHLFRILNFRFLVYQQFIVFGLALAPKTRKILQQYFNIQNDKSLYENWIVCSDAYVLSQFKKEEHNPEQFIVKSTQIC